MILTHPHSDHLNGLIEVLQRYEVKQVLTPDIDYNSPLYDEWLRLIREKNIKCTAAQEGQQIDLGNDTTMQILNSPKPLLTAAESDIDNNGSIVLRLSTGKASFLFTADIGAEVERELISKRADLKSTVLKVAHHGSDTSTTQELLAVVNPQLAVISVGADNEFGHPSPEIISRLKDKPGLENTYRTDEQGTIEFTTYGERIWIKTGK